MCGRFKRNFSEAQITERFQASLGPDVQWSTGFNIAPGTFQPIIRASASGRLCEAFWWGLIPYWAKEKSFGARTVNARGETVAVKPAFRAAFRARRCLIPADGYYEWSELGPKKQPYLMGLASCEPFAFGGLWESWSGPDGKEGASGASIELRSFCLITTEPNELCAKIHDRMPVIVPAEHYDRWLDPALKDPAAIQAMVIPYPAEEMIAYPGSTRVNNVRNQGPELAERFEPEFKLL